MFFTIRLKNIHRASALLYPIHFEAFKLHSQPHLQTHNTLASTMSFQVPRPNFHSDQLKNWPQGQSSQSSQPVYAESTYSTSTTYSEKPLVASSTSEQRTSKRSKAWQKTKDLLAKIPEPERKQKPAVVGPETEEEKLKRLRKFGELDYGSYQGGPYSGHVWSR